MLKQLMLVTVSLTSVQAVPILNCAGIFEVADPEVVMQELC
jgi:hypothetical protein